MSNAPDFTAYPRETASSNLAEVVTLYLQANGEAIAPLLPLPFDMTVEDWGKVREKPLKGVGTIFANHVELDTRGVGRSEFQMVTIEPDQPMFDLPVEMSTPLGIAVDGYSTYVAIQLAKAGMAVRLIGTNLVGGRSLLHDAQASLMIMSQADEERQSNQTTQAGTSVFSGYSMGIMKQLAELGLAPRMGREVALTLGLDPAAANKVDYSLREALKFGRFMLEETTEIPQIVWESVREDGPLKTLARAGHLLPTVDLRPSFALNTLRKLHTIASGETGTFIADIPPEAVLIIHAFTRSVYNDEATYRQALAGHPNARIISEDGRHLSGGYLSTIQRVVDKLTLGQQLHQEGVKPHELSLALGDPVLKASRKAA